MKKCKIKEPFQAGDYFFQQNESHNFEDETAAALAEAGLIEIVGDVEPETEPEEETEPAEEKKTRKRGGANA